MAVADTRVLLVRHAPTRATRAAAFPADEDLDAAGRDAAVGLAAVDVDRVVCSPLRRCRQTATAAGWAVDTLDPRWAELDFGAWAGRGAGAVAEVASAALEAWYADPVATAPPDGETLSALAARVGSALADLHGRPGTTAVVTSGGPAKVAVLQALRAPLERIWNVEVAPMSLTELRPRSDGGWTLVAGQADRADTGWILAPARGGPA